jgi:hypothetical protein
MNRMSSVRRWLLVSMIAVAVALPVSAGVGEAAKPQTGKPASPVVIEVSRDHFDWQDAGVGAAAMLALVAIGFGLTLVIRDRPGLRALEREEVKR